MGLFETLSMLLLSICLVSMPNLNAQTPKSSITISPARSLDQVLQDYAFRAFVRPKTGVSYDGVVPSNLSGIRISSMRLRSGSLRSRGVDKFKEFEIPIGVVASPYVERLVLVYQNLGNWSMVYYPLDGYTYLTPILGLLAYDASNLSATNLPELGISATENPISIVFPDVKSVPDGSIAKCVWFDLHGLVNFSNVVSGNLCSMIQQGHFSIVIESIAPSPGAALPIPPISPTPTSSQTPPNGGKKSKGGDSKTWVVVGFVLGGLVLLVLLGLLIAWGKKYKQKKKMERMERASEVGETLRMASVGNTRAPTAMVTRTQPTIENDYVP